MYKADEFSFFFYRQQRESYMFIVNLTKYCKKVILFWSKHLRNLELTK